MKYWMVALILFVTNLSQATTFTVINTNDTGAGSLRAAISNVNFNVGTHLINFAISPLDGTVKTITPLTTLPVINRPVTIDGYTQDPAHSHPNTQVTSDDAVLLIELTGTFAGGDGLGLAASNCVVRGLVVNGWVVNGISISFVSGGGATNRNCLVEGCFVGTDPTGMIKHGNGQGILAAEPNLLVGGSTLAARNLVSGNNGIGINTGGGSVTNVLIENNFVGIDRTGTNGLGNGGAGVTITTATKNSVIGNVIGGNAGAGVTLNTAGNIVQGNAIGTDITASLNLSNHTAGVALTSASDNVIGGASAGNFIAFNGGAGVSVSQGVPNRTNNLISANGIFRKGALGIDLDALGVTSNDTCSAGAGANRLQNFPVITSATSDGSSSITIAGFLHSVPSTIYTLEFFVNNVCDPSGFGEGETFIGSTNVLTGANCTNVFTATLPVGVPEGLVLTATATDPNNNTSEFSRCVPIAGPAPFRITAITRTGNDIRVTWTMSPGQTNALQRTAGAPNGSYSTNNFAPIFTITNTVGSVTNYLDVGGATNKPSRYYRVRLVP
jgi:hypothetical protein